MIATLLISCLTFVAISALTVVIFLSEASEQDRRSGAFPTCWRAAPRPGHAFDAAPSRSDGWRKPVSSRGQSKERVASYLRKSA